MCRFMLIFDILKHGSSTLNFNSSDNIARIIKCDISKSKLALSTCNGVYFSSTALIVFTLYEIKQVKQKNVILSGSSSCAESQTG